MHYFLLGGNGLSDLRGGQTPETVSEGSSVEPEAKVNHIKEEQRHGEGESGVFLSCVLVIKLSMNTL